MCIVESGYDRDRTPYSDVNDVGAVCLSQGCGENLSHRPARVDLERVARCTRRDRHLCPPGDGRFEVCHQRRHGFVGALAGGDPQGDLGPGAGHDLVDGLRDRRRVQGKDRDGGLSPHTRGEAVRSDELEAVHRPHLAAELCFGETGIVGLSADQAADGDVALVVME